VTRSRWTRRRAKSIALLTIAVAVLIAGAVVGLGARHHDADVDLRTSGTPSSPSTSRPQPPLRLDRAQGPPIPASGAYLGSWVYPQPDNQSGKVASVRRFEKLIGRPLDIVHLYRKWGMPIGTESDLAFARSGKYLLLSLAATDMREIASGHEDAMIAQIAHQVAALPTKVFLAFRTEMNRPNLQSMVHSPQDFVAAWHRFRGIFLAHRVANVAWTWCPTAAGFDDGTAEQYYPGDDEVDWVCADIYPKTPWQRGDNEAFSTLANAFVKWAARHPKPVIIGEMAVGDSYGSRRPGWIADAGHFVETHPQIKAIVWFDQSLPEDPDFYRYALEGDPAAVRAFARLAQDGYFGRR
jgi:hypothetical protein